MSAQQEANEGMRMERRRTVVEADPKFKNQNQKIGAL